METRKGWGMVVMAAMFAIAVIATAVGTLLFNGESTKESALEATAGSSVNDTDGDGLATWEELAWGTDPAISDTDNDGISDGAEVTGGTDPAPKTSPDGKLVLSEYAPTVSLIRNVYAATPYITDTGSTPKDKNAVIDTVIANSVRTPDFNEYIPLSAIRVSTSTSLSAYADITYLVLRQATQIKEYELITFRETVESNQYTGTPALKRAATVYKQIEAALLAMEVPPQIASDHLLVVNGIGSLANVVDAMSVWGGDPLQGLLYIDTFIQKEADLKTKMGMLFQKLQIFRTTL